MTLRKAKLDHLLNEIHAAGYSLQPMQLVEYHRADGTVDRFTVQTPKTKQFHRIPRTIPGEDIGPTDVAPTEE